MINKEAQKARGNAFSYRTFMTLGLLMLVGFAIFSIGSARAATSNVTNSTQTQCYMNTTTTIPSNFNTNSNQDSSAGVIDTQTFPYTSTVNTTSVIPNTTTIATTTAAQNVVQNNSTTIPAGNGQNASYSGTKSVTTTTGKTMFATYSPALFAALGAVLIAIIIGFISNRSTPSKRKR
jgi:hypothetical protein